MKDTYDNNKDSNIPVTVTPPHSPALTYEQQSSTIMSVPPAPLPLAATGRQNEKKFRFSTVILTYILFFAACFIVLGMIRPTPVMRFVRLTVGNPSLNMSLLPVDWAAAAGSPKSSVARNFGEAQKQQQRSARLLAWSGGEGDGTGDGGDFSSGGGGDEDGGHGGDTPPAKSADGDDGTGTPSKNKKKTKTDKTSKKSKKTAAPPAPTSSPPDAVEFPVPPQKLQPSEVGRYIAYLNDTRLASKTRMICPWYFFFDYPLAYFLTETVGLKNVPGMDANVVSLSHPFFAIACVYFLLTSVREVPVTREEEMEDTSAVENPSSPLHFLDSSNGSGNLNDKSTSCITAGVGGGSSSGGGGSGGVLLAAETANATALCSTTNNNNNNSTSLESTGVFMRRSHSRVVLPSTIDVASLFSSPTLATGSSNNSSNNQAADSFEMRALKSSSGTEGSPLALSVSNSMNNNNMASSPGSLNAGGAADAVFPLSTSSAGAATVGTPNEARDSTGSSSAAVNNSANSNNYNGAASGGSSSVISGSLDILSVAGLLYKGQTRVIHDPQRLRYASMCLLTRNFLDTLDGVMARSQRLSGIPKTGVLKDVDGHTMDMIADGLGGALVFLTIFFTLHRRRLLLDPFVSRLLSRLGCQIHRQRPLQVARIVAFLGILCTIATIGAMWESFVRKYVPLFEPNVVRYAPDLVPVENKFTVRLGLFMWSTICGDSLLFLMVISMAFDLVWEAAQYLCFVYLPLAFSILVYNLIVWHVVVLQNPIAGALWASMTGPAQGL